jgi:hypothetical protein
MQDQPIPEGYCQCGCGQRTKIATVNDRSNGWTAGVPKRFLRGHGSGKRIKYVEDENGCWIWQLSLDQRGYGRVHRDGRSRFAHRWMWEQRVGELDRRTTLHHKCQVKACVNPDHLEPLDAAKHAQLHTPGDVTDEDVRAIRAATGTLAEIASRFGLSLSYVHALRAGKWRRDAYGLPDPEQQREAA